MTGQMARKFPIDRLNMLKAFLGAAGRWGEFTSLREQFKKKFACMDSPPYGRLSEKRRLDLARWAAYLQMKNLQIADYPEWPEVGPSVQEILAHEIQDGAAAISPGTMKNREHSATAAAKRRAKAMARGGQPVDGPLAEMPSFASEGVSTGLDAVGLEGFDKEAFDAALERVGRMRNPREASLWAAEHCMLAWPQIAMENAPGKFALTELYEAKVNSAYRKDLVSRVSRVATGKEEKDNVQKDDGRRLRKIKEVLALAQAAEGEEEL